MKRALVLGLVGTGILSASIVRAQSADPTIRIGVGAADTFAEGFYATELGIFKKNGLQVEMHTFTQGAAIVTAAAGNAIDIGISNTVNLVLAIAHGAPFRIIAGAGMYASKSPTTVLMVAKGSPLANPAELAGKTIAVTALKDLTEVGVRAWLERNGIDARAVHFAEIPMPQMPAALARGTVDAAVIGEPWITSSRDSLRTFATFYDAIAPRFLIADWFANTTFIAKNPSVVGRFVEAVNETARWANAHRAESAAILAKWVKLDPSFVASMGRCEYATSLESSELDPVLAAMATYQVLDRRVHIDDVAWRGRP